MWGGIILVGTVPNEGWLSLNAMSLPVVPCALLAILSAFAMPGGLGMWMFGLRLETRRGRSAGRLRSGWRAIVAWSPLLAQALPSLIPPALFHLPDDPPAHALGMILGDGLVRLMRLDGIPAVMGILLLLAFWAGVAAALHTPERGWQDRLAGTRIVPS
jgi:hypothetical protein